MSHLILMQGIYSGSFHLGHISFLPVFEPRPVVAVPGQSA
jgi:hypothetical protein